ncbi:MAG: helix-turn-helix domain-containing protein, partial [Lysobacter sp.]
GTTLIHCDVRVVAATHRNLETHIHEGKFREDLFYRLNVFPIEMPPLRERVADLPDLIGAITRQLADSGRGRVALSDSAVTALGHYDWPGNVRELSNLLERLAVLHPSGTVRATDLPARYRAALPDLVEDEAIVGITQDDLRTVDPANYSPTATLPPEGMDLRSHMADIELELIRAALQQADGVVAHAAPLLGLRRTTLVEKLRKYGIERD